MSTSVVAPQKTQRRTLYVATGNAGKLRDFATAALAFVPSMTSEEGSRNTAIWAIEPLPGLESMAAPEEDQDTFTGNAALKATYYSRFLPGELVIADDSGLEVDALAGAPGVYSARYAELAGTPPSALEEHTKDERNNQHLLAELAAVLTSQGRLANLDARSARYRCVLAVARDGELITTADGAVEGLILLEPRGAGGFGYDPLFYLPGYERAMAELDPVTRMGLSHRGEALRALLAKLTE